MLKILKRVSFCVTVMCLGFAGYTALVRDIAMTIYLCANAIVFMLIFIASKEGDCGCTKNL